MKNFSSLAIVAAITVTLLNVASVQADDTEVFFGNVPASSSAPNVLLIIDTSGSMNEEASSSRTPYNPLTTYSVSGCSSNDVYYVAATSSTVPSCSSSRKISKSNFYCSPATSALSSSGKYIGNGIRWMRREIQGPDQYYWSADFNPNNRTPQAYVTCEDDTGDTRYPRAGTTTTSTDEWGGTSSNNYFSPANSPVKTSYVFYDGNYVAWANDSSQVVEETRMDVVRTAAKELIDSLNGINVGLMSYSANGAGGMVRFAVADVATNRAALKTAIDNLHSGGYTPLSETLAEGYRYFRGDPVAYGLNSTACPTDMSGDCASSDVSTPSVSSSRTGANGANYLSPITSSCQQNYVVFLTDGLPNQDNQSNSFIEGLDTAAGNTCYSSSSNMWQALGRASVPNITYYDGTTGLCLKEMSRNLKSKDLSSLTGAQNVTTYFIGFGNNVGAGAPQEYLADAAHAGGGTAEIAANAAELASAFERTIGAVLDSSSTFTSPSVAVNSFNKTQVLEDLYVSMFEPTQNKHWPGNVKKFKFRDNKIVGRGSTMNSVDTVSAVDPSTGFFTRNTKDFWHQIADVGLGNETTSGGTTNRIPAPSVRNLYTYVGNAKPTSAQLLSDHPLATSNTAVTDALLNIGGASDPSRSVLINWARGDEDGDVVNTPDDVRLEMGDPLHAQPAVVIYGNSGASTTDRLNDAVVYTATNDGYLHAIDVTSGTELWAYVPQELLPDLKILHADAITSTKHYSLDGDVRVLKYDVDGDGVVEPSDNDRVFLYFSQGRGGSRYYALDVTNKNSPKYLWSLGTADLGNIVTKSWSTPTLGRVRVGGSANQNTQRLVLIFGGGYDDIEDSQSYFAAGDPSGNGIFMVDAVKGTLLWSVTKVASGAFANMTHAIPSSITVLDTNNDGWSDRMYAGDMAGQVWRLDITNGNAASSLVAGGVIATLGGKISATVANNRSFYNPPDVAKFVNRSGSNFYNIAIGSGDRALPKSNVTTEDRFYSIRDYFLGPMTQSQYDGFSPVRDSDLTTVDGSTAQSFTDSSRGWKLVLNTGEKVLASSITVEGTVMFTTYLAGSSTSNVCSVTSGSGRAYSIEAMNALKRFDDLYETFPVTGLPTQVAIVAPSQMIRTDGTTPTPDPTAEPSTSTEGTCFSGVSILGKCVDFGERVKTFWQDASAY